MFEYIIAACLIAVYFIVGALFDSLSYKRYSLPFSLVAGFICVNALFFLIAYPFRAIGLSFTLLTYVFTVLLAIAVLAGAYSLVLCGLWKGYIQNICSFFHSERCFKLSIFAFVLVLLAFSFTLSLQEYPDTDDSMYMAKAMEILKTDSLDIQESVSWLGWDSEQMNDSTDASTLEAFHAYLSRITGIAVAVLCRKTIILVNTVIVCCTVFSFGTSLFDDVNSKIKSLIMLAVYVALVIVFNSVFDSVPYRQIRTPWHGKAIVCTIIFPLIMSVCKDIYSHSGRIIWHEWIYLALIITASISASIIGVNFTVIYCVVMAGPLLIFRLLTKKKVAHLFLPACIAALPTIVFSGIALLKVVTSNRGYFTRFVLPDWLGCFNKIFLVNSYGVVLVLLIAALLYFIVKGTKEQRLLFAGTTAFLFLSFLNPLLIYPVSKYLTSGSVYWRLYWIIPVWTCISAAAADSIVEKRINNAKLYLKGILVCLIGVLIFIYSIFGSIPNNLLTNIFRSAYPERVNPYAVSYETIACADYILRDSTDSEPRLLDLSIRDDSCETYAIRQYTADIDLCVGIRDNQVALMTDIIDGEDISVAEFVNKVCTSGEVLDKDMLKNAIIHMQADYVFAPRDILPDNDFLTLLLNCEEHVLMRVEIAQ